MFTKSAQGHPFLHSCALHSFFSSALSEVSGLVLSFRAAYKLKGPSEKTNFELTEMERMHIDGMEWEDLLLEMQLQDLAQSSPGALPQTSALFVF